ncbi:MAG: M18 family aminopeptidase [Bacteriovoracaceae bacterium]|nr:M18 family aminopeptidase [Bacteriovoracaceae bacterium]
MAAINLESFNHGLIDFIGNSPTAFHATSNMKKILVKNGFNELKESDTWNIDSGKYFIVRNDSGLLAFTICKKNNPALGFKMIGAHTDSPSLKVKPNAEKIANNYLQLGVEVYGGPLLTTWFDRDLSMAGKVIYLDKNEKIQSTLLDFKRAIATIPSLAIHLDRDANDKKSVQKQKDLPPLLGQIHGKGNKSFKDILMKELESSSPNLEIKKILDHDMCFYDVQKPAIVGINGEFITGARLDNLICCYCGLMSIIENHDDTNTLLVCNDHEECGSSSNVGAGGPMLKDILQRVCSNFETYSRMIANSMLVSCDNAHAIHPNFPEKSEENHGPLLNHGPAIKINHNQRYATTSETAAYFTYIAGKAESPVQKFISRTDMPCGSTIGPITASNIGVKTIDVGVPTFGMHSIRETAGYKDSWYLYNILSCVFNSAKDN